VHITNKKILIFSIALSLILIPLFFWTTGIARITLSIFVILFIPGYSLLSALFPSCNSMSSGHRIALSFGVSIVVVSGLGLFLHFIPLDLNITSIFFAVVLSNTIISAIAFFKETRLPEKERLSFRINVSLPKWNEFKGLDKGLFALMIFALLALVITFSYFAFTPNKGEQYSEFYVLDFQGGTEHYPEQIKIGESVFVTLGIISHEENPTNYRVETNLNGFKLNETMSGSLSKGEKWEKVITLTPQQIGISQQLEFWLFKFDQDQPYNKNSLHLVMDVTPESDEIKSHKNVN
jgi:uncharacterized membrane protein